MECLFSNSNWQILIFIFIFKTMKIFLEIYIERSTSLSDLLRIAIWTGYLICATFTEIIYVDVFIMCHID